MKIFDDLRLCDIFLKVAESISNIFLTQSANVFLVGNFLYTKTKVKLKSLKTSTQIRLSESEPFF